jgi:hypothetical protein
MPVIWAVKEAQDELHPDRVDCNSRPAQKKVSCWLSGGAHQSSQLCKRVNRRTAVQIGPGIKVRPYSKDT